MVIAAPEPQATLKPRGEQRVVFRGIAWQDRFIVEVDAEAVIDGGG